MKKLILMTAVTLAPFVHCFADDQAGLTTLLQLNALSNAATNQVVYPGSLELIDLAGSLKESLQATTEDLEVNKNIDESKEILFCVGVVNATLRISSALHSSEQLEAGAQALLPAMGQLYLIKQSLLTVCNTSMHISTEGKISTLATIKSWAFPETTVTQFKVSRANKASSDISRAIRAIQGMYKTLNPSAMP